MRLPRFFALVVAALVFETGPLVAQQATTLEGTLVDGKCYLMNHANTGNDHGSVKACGTMCLKGGTPAAVVTKDGQFHPIMAAAGSFADIVGQTVRVTGPVEGDSVLAKKVEVNKGGRWQEVKLTGMQG
jgi:hypothetical protein